MKNWMKTVAAMAILSGSAFANDGFYAGALGGANWLEGKSEHFTYDLVQPDQSIVSARVKKKIKMETGYVVGGFAGYKFDCNSGCLENFRVEAELSYRHNKIKHVEATIKSSGATIVGRAPLEGHFSSLAVLGNVIYDVNYFECVTPYLGAGVGFAHTDSRIKVDHSSIKDRDNSFAWQLIAGVSYPVYCNMDLGVEYRYLNITDFQNNNAVVASLKYNF